MTAFNSQFSTVTVYSDPAKHTAEPGRLKAVEPTEPRPEPGGNGGDSWVGNVKSAAKRRRNRVKARAELEALGIDPDRFLDYHRVQL